MGEWGASHGAARPANTIALRMNSGSTNAGFDSTRPRNLAYLRPRRKTGKSGLVPDPGVEVGIENIDQQVDDQKQSSKKQHHTLRHRIVAKSDRLDGQAAEARPTEYRLGND